MKLDLNEDKKKAVCNFEISEPGHGYVILSQHSITVLPSERINNYNVFRVIVCKGEVYKVDKIIGQEYVSFRDCCIECNFD